MNNYPYEALGEVFLVIGDAHNEGVTLPEALEKGIANCDDQRVKSAVQAMLDGWNNNQDIITPMKEHEDVFPPMVIQLTSLGFQAGTLASVWPQLGEACKNMAAAS